MDFSSPFRIAIVTANPVNKLMATQQTIQDEGRMLTELVPLEWGQESHQWALEVQDLVSGVTVTHMGTTCPLPMVRCKCLKDLNYTGSSAVKLEL